MNTPTAKDVILNSAPTEHRVEYARCLDRLSRNPNDPFFVVFSIITQSYHKNSAILQAKLEAAEERDKQRIEKLEKERAENLKAIRNEVTVITGMGIGWRIITNKIVGTVIIVVVVSILANRIIQSKVQTIDPEFHTKIQSVEQRIDAQAHLQNAKIDSIARTTEQLSTATKTNATSTYETLVGKSLSLYVFDLSEKTITLQTGNSNKAITLEHNLNSQEYEQLRLAIEIVRKISTD